MNTVPRLLQDFSWATIASFSANEIGELVMLTLMAVGLVGVIVYSVYRALSRRKSDGGK